MKPNLLAFLALAMGATLPGAAFAQAGAEATRPAPEQPARPAPRPVAPVTIKQLRDNVYAALGGAGGVSGVVVGDKGVIVIDAKQTPDSATQTIARIGEITPKPVTTIILTGNGGEGIPGLAAYPAGLKIISHATTQKALERLASANARNRAPADKMPNVIIKDERKLLTLEGVRMVFLHIAPSHTVAESSIYLPDQRIVFTGYESADQPGRRYLCPRARRHLDQGADGTASGRAASGL
jgi:glyoxylase-like metal-dependent hydrolase (beta-lactamase superfamily II)